MEIRYSDVDFKDELSASALLAFAQDAAGTSADELGFGYGDLKPLGYGFLIVNTYCEYKKPILLGDTLTVQTWPLTPRHVIFERDTRVLNGKGEECAALASRWCLVDLNGMRLLTPESLSAHKNCPYRDEKTVEVPNWKIPKLGEEGKFVCSFTVAASHCDHYLHANNTRYADFFFDCFTMDELIAKKVKSFQIVYSKQLKEGTQADLFRKDCADGMSSLEARADGGLATQFRVQFMQGENE